MLAIDSTVGFQGETEKRQIQLYLFVALQCYISGCD